MLHGWGFEPREQERRPSRPASGGEQSTKTVFQKPSWVKLEVNFSFFPELSGSAARTAVPCVASRTHSQYSRGCLVPPFALTLLWQHRGRLATASFQLNWWGAVPAAAGTALYLVLSYGYFDWREGVSLPPCRAGVPVLLGGWPGRQSPSSSGRTRSGSPTPAAG